MGRRSGLRTDPDRRGDRSHRVAYGWIPSVINRAKLTAISQLRSLQGHFGEARELLIEARRSFEELGNRHRLAGLMDGESQIAHLAGDLESARQSGSAAFEAMTATGDRSFASTFAVNLGRVLVDLGHLDDAWRYGAIAQDDSSSDDVISQAGGRAVRARVLSSRDENAQAILLAREAEIHDGGH